MKEMQTSCGAICNLIKGSCFEGFELIDENFMWNVYWGGTGELVKADIDFPIYEGEESEDGRNFFREEDFRYISSDFILKHKPDNVHVVTVIYNDWMKGAVLQYGNYPSDPGWVKLGDLCGFA